MGPRLLIRVDEGRLKSRPTTATRRPIGFEARAFESGVRQ